MGIVDSIRRGLVSRYADLGGMGLELGPYAHPTFLKSETDIRYADVQSREQLIAGLPSHSEAASVPDVDYVVPGGQFCDVIGDRFSYVIANHVFEHAPDPIRWLQNMEALLIDGGILFLALPDKIFTFDYHRPDTILSDVVHSYLIKRREIGRGKRLEVELLYRGRGAPEDFRAQLSIARLAELHDGPLHPGLHANVFQSGTILDALIRPLLLTGLLYFDLLDFVPARASTGGEMFLILRKAPPCVQLNPATFYAAQNAGPIDASEPVPGDLAALWQELRPSSYLVATPDRLTTSAFVPGMPLSDLLSCLRYGLAAFPLDLTQPAAATEDAVILCSDGQDAAMRAAKDLPGAGRPSRVVLLARASSQSDTSALRQSLRDAFAERSYVVAGDWTQHGDPLIVLYFHAADDQRPAAYAGVASTVPVNVAE